MHHAKTPFYFIFSLVHISEIIEITKLHFWFLWHCHNPQRWSASQQFGKSISVISKWERLLSMAERVHLNKVYSIKRLPGEQTTDGFKCSQERLFRQSESNVCWWVQYIPVHDNIKLLIFSLSIKTSKQTQKKTLKSYLLITDNWMMELLK